jgi:tetratricopeptide (TPR) repeat protein
MLIGKRSAGRFGFRPPAQVVGTAALLLVCSAGTGLAQDPQDPFSTPGAVTGTDTSNTRGAQGQPQPRPDRQTREAIRDATETRYREILSAWASGNTEQAAADLIALETSVVSDEDVNSRKRLLKAEQSVIHEVGASDLETLVPIAMLHHEVYERYLGMGAKGRSLVLGHARNMARDLALLYQEQSGTEGAALVSSRILTSLGGLLQKHAQQLPAAELFFKAVEMDPRNVAAHLGIATIYEKNSQFESAVDSLRKLLAVDPGHEEARLRLGINLRRLGKNDEARKVLQELTQVKTASWVTPLAYQELARLFVEQGSPAGAESTLQAAVERFPEDARLYVQLASVLDRKGEIRRAQQVMDKVGSLPPASEASGRYLYNTTRDETFAEARKFLDDNARSRRALLAQALGVPTRGSLALGVGQ